MPPRATAGVFRRMLDIPATHRAALDGLRRTIQRLENRDDSLRPLEHTVPQQARLDSAAARDVMVILGDALIADGDLKAGLDTLDLAARSGWDAALFRRVARTKMRLGDTTAAIPLLARVAVDPSTSSAEVDSLRTLGQEHVGAQRWRTLVDGATSAMTAAVLADAVSIPISRSPRLQRFDGRTTTLAAAANGRVAVVTFWSRYCAPSRQDLKALPALAEQLSRHGVMLVAVTAEAPSDDLRAFVRQQKLELPLYSDRWGEAGRAFQKYGTPMYFVVDGAGRIRFRYTTLRRVLAQAMVLSATSRTMRTADR